MWWWMESVWELEMVDTLSITLMSSLPRETDTPVSGTGKTMGKTISHLRRHPIVKPSCRISVGEVFLDISGIDIPDTSTMDLNGVYNAPMIFKRPSPRSKDACFTDRNAQHQLADAMSLADFLAAGRQEGPGLYLWLVLLQSKQGIIQRSALAERIGTGDVEGLKYGEVKGC